MFFNQWSTTAPKDTGSETKPEPQKDTVSETKTEYVMVDRNGTPKPRFSDAIGNRSGIYQTVRVKALYEELKSVTLSQTSYSIGSGQIVACNLISQGDDVTNRQGRVLSMRSIQLYGTVGPNSSTSNGGRCRIMLLYDKFPTGTTATVGNVLTVDANSFLLFGNLQRFEVIYDGSFDCPAYDRTVAVYNNSPNHLVDFKHTFSGKGRIMEYIDNGSTIASVLKGTIYMLVIGTTTSGYLFTGGPRIRFVDA